MHIGFDAISLDEDIKSGQGKGQPRLERRPGPMPDFLQLTDAMQPREDRLDQHAGIPETALTQFEICRVTLSRVECRITQDNHTSQSGGEKQDRAHGLQHNPSRPPPPTD